MNKIHVLLLCCCLCLCGYAFSAQAAPSNRIVAVVNGKMITMFDLEEAARPEYMRQKQADPAKVRRTVLDEMILEMLLKQEAERLQISVSDAEVDQELLNMMKVRNMSKDMFQKQLAKEGLSVAFLRARLKSNMLKQRLLGRQVGRMVVVSPEEIQAYYDAHRSSFVRGGGANVALLIYPPNENAEKWAAQISSGKITFEDVVARISIGPNREQGGKIGIPDHQISPDMRKRITAMQSGDVSGIFMLEGHKAQFKLFGIAEGGEPLSLAEATPRIDALLREPKAKERFEEYIKQLQNKAVIDIRL